MWSYLGHECSTKLSNDHEWYPNNRDVWVQDVAVSSVEFDSERATVTMQDGRRYSVKKEVIEKVFKGWLENARNIKEMV